MCDRVVNKVKIKHYEVRVPPDQLLLQSPQHKVHCLQFFSSCIPKLPIFHPLRRSPAPRCNYFHRSTHLKSNHLKSSCSVKTWMNQPKIVTSKLFRTQTLMSFPKTYRPQTFQIVKNTAYHIVPWQL